MPGLVYMTDIAFPSDDAKVPWLAGLQAESLTAGRNLCYLIPPLCISTGTLGPGWDELGTELAATATDVPAPVIILGPSPRLNREGDGFPTYLPAGYLFAAHFLGSPDQRLTVGAYPRGSGGRFRVIGAGFVEMRKSLDKALWGEGPDDQYGFAADFYLFLVMNLLVTGLYHGGMPAKAPELFSFLYYIFDPDSRTKLRTSTILRKCVIGGEPLRFALGRYLGHFSAPLDKVLFAPPPGSTLVEANPETRGMTLVKWFNIARAQLPVPPEEPNEEGER